MHIDCHLRNGSDYVCDRACLNRLCFDLSYLHQCLGSAHYFVLRIEARHRLDAAALTWSVPVQLGPAQVCCAVDAHIRICRSRFLLPLSLYLSVQLPFLSSQMAHCTTLQRNVISVRIAYHSSRLSLIWPSSCPPPNRPSRRGPSLVGRSNHHSDSA